MEESQGACVPATVALVIPLEGVSCGGQFTFANDVEMKWIPDEWRPHLAKTAAQAGRGSDVGLMTHCLVIKNVELSRGADADTQIRQAWRPANEALLRLRLQKPGDIGFSFVFVASEEWLQNPAEASAPWLVAIPFYRVWHRPHVSCTYTLDAQEAREVRQIFEVSWTKKLMSDTAFRQFFRSYHEPYATDRFLDNVVGLESFLITDTNEKSGMTHKFRDRGAFLLTCASRGRGSSADDYYEDLGQLYRARSKLVHPTKQSKEDWSTEEENSLIALAENHIRTLLRFSLSHAWARDSVKVEKHKRALYHRRMIKVQEEVPPRGSRLLLCCVSEDGTRKYWTGSLLQGEAGTKYEVLFSLDEGQRLSVSDQGRPALLVTPPGAPGTMEDSRDWSELLWMPLDDPSE